MTFAHPYVLLLLLLLPLLAWLKGKVGFQPAFLYSSVQLVRGITGITRSRAGSILLKLFRGANIDSIQLRTDQPYASALGRFFETREKRRRHG